MTPLTLRGEPRYSLLPLGRIHDWPPGASPVTLLDPRYEIVEFIGRSAERRALKSWFQSRERHTLQLMAGPAGSGKTRLATQVARELAGGEWKALIARHEVDGAAIDPSVDKQMDYLLLGWSGAFVIVEDADHWRMSDLVALADRCHYRTDRTRLLLLCRSDAVWPLLRRSLDPEQWQSGPALRVGSLEDDAEREAIFSAAVRAFANRLEMSPVSPGGRQHEFEPPAGSAIPISILSAALAAVLELSSAAPEELSQRILEHDLLQGNSGTAESAASVTPGAVTVLTVLLRGMPRDDAAELFRRVGLDRPEERIAAHQLRYLPPDLRVLHSPYPDSFGEDLIALLLTAEDSTAEDRQEPSRPTAGITDAVELAAHIHKAIETLREAAGREIDMRFLPAAITVLIETARRWPEIGPWLASFLQWDASGITTLNLTAVRQLCDLRGIEPALTAMSFAMDMAMNGAPAPETVAAAVLVAERLAEYCRAAGDRSGLAAALAVLGPRLASAGRYDDAVMASKESAMIARAQVMRTSEPTSDRPEDDNADQRYDLFRSLVNLAYVLSPADQEGCLSAIAEAIALYRQLPDADRESSYMLAAQIYSQALYLRRADRDEDALQAISESIVLGRELAGLDVKANRELGKYLRLRSEIFTALGRIEESLADAQEEVEVYVRLAEAAPGPAPDLAGALMRSSLMLMHLDHPESAEPMLRRAVDVYRRSAPDTLDDLASFAIALALLSRCLVELGRLREAVAPEAEAVAAYRSLADQSPRYLPDLIEALNDLGIRYADAGQRDSALRANERAVRLARVLAESSSHEMESLSGLGRSLNNLALRLTGAGQPGRAVETAREAVEVFERLERFDPDTSKPLLASTLMGLSKCLIAAGQPQLAADAARRAIVLFEVLDENGTNRSRADLAEALTSFGTALGLCGEYEKALEHGTRAVGLFRELASRAPGRYQPELAGALLALTAEAAYAERWPEAVNWGEEAVAAYRSLAAGSQGRYLVSLATALSNQGGVLTQAGRHDEAAENLSEAVEVWRGIVATEPTRRGGLAGALVNWSVSLQSRNQELEASTAADEAVQIFRQLAAEAPEIHLPGLVTALAARADVLAARDITAAMSVLHEAILILRGLAEANPGAYGRQVSEYEDTLAQLASRGTERSKSVTDPDGRRGPSEADQSGGAPATD